MEITVTIKYEAEKEVRMKQKSLNKLSLSSAVILNADQGNIFAKAVNRLAKQRKFVDQESIM